MIVKFCKTNPDVKIPTQVPGSVGLDIYPYFTEDYMIIPSHTTKMIPTGLKVMLPEGYFVLLEERGSTGSKGIKRSAGVVDNSYRGEIFAAITNANDWNVCIYKGNKDSIANMRDMMLLEADADDEELNRYKKLKGENLRHWNRRLVESRFDDDGNPVDTFETHFYPYEKAIVQGIVLPSYEIESQEISVNEYDKYNTSRGEGALGSSGK